MISRNSMFRMLKISVITLTLTKENFTYDLSVEFTRSVLPDTIPSNRGVLRTYLNRINDVATIFESNQYLN